MDLYFELPGDLPAEWNDSEKIKKAIADELAKQEIAGEVDWRPDPLSTKKDRELVLVILAVGAASVLVAHAVKKVLDNINPEKPTVVYEKKAEPIISGGKPVMGADGQPLIKYTETPVIVQPGGNTEFIGLNAFKVFEIRSSSERHAPGEKPQKGPSATEPPQQGRST